MPFKLFFKTRQYNVVSKSLFVISIELLDGVVVECTLSTDSLGQECLENVCQRLVINQPEFFGLRYINRNQQARWIHLDKPLKRQLDKYASSHQLYLRIMYYIVNGTSLITDEVTRSHYFLQLKNDLIEGRIVCDFSQAIMLAAYSRQAEYGNHDRERHTVEYLKNLLPFPKQMIEGGQIVESSDPGRLEWLTGAVIQQHQTLSNMSQAQAEEGYISVCQQLRGYGQETFVASQQREGGEVMIAISLTGIMVASENSDAPHLYRWTDITNVINHKCTFSIECQNVSESATFELATPEDGKYIWRMCVLQHTFYMKHKQNMYTGTQHHHETNDMLSQQVKFQETSLSESRDDLDCAEHRGSMPGLLEPIHQLTPAQRASSTSCIDLTSHQHQNLRDLDRLKALLPSYRAAPDYETAIQQKLQEQRAHVGHYPNHHDALTNTNKPMLYGSHPDIHQPIHYPDVTRHTMNHNYAMHQNAYLHLHHNVTDMNPQLQYVNIYKPPPPYPSNGLASNSTPDLAVASQALNNYHHSCINAHVSGSSPDLVSNRSALGKQFLGYQYIPNVHVNYGHVLHGTFNNLTNVSDVPKVIMDPRNPGVNNIRKVYDERGNIIYSIPQPVPYQRRVLTLSKTHEPIYENVPLPWQKSDGMTQIAKSAEQGPKPAERQTPITKISNVNISQNNLNVADYINPSFSDDNHYANAGVITGVREASANREVNVSNSEIATSNNGIHTSNRDHINVSNKSINKANSIDNVRLNVDQLSINDKIEDDTPYQSLSAHKVNISNNNVYDKISQSDNNNVTSITIHTEPEIRRSLNSNKTYITQQGDYHNNSTVTASSGIESGATNVTNSTQFSSSLDLDSSVNTTKSGSINSKEKKRRRWGVFIGRSNKNVDVKSATLGRDKSKSSAPIVQNIQHRWSTGLPKFQPLPPSITKETLCRILENKMSEAHLTFNEISQRRDSNNEMNIARLPEHAPYNGFNYESLPYDDNRVRLNPTPYNKYGYINASHVTMTIGNSQRFYVVCRLPTQIEKYDGALSVERERELVWAGIWTVGARVVALISDVSSPMYLPKDHKDVIKAGQYSVRLESREKCDFGFTSRVNVTYCERSRTVWHIHYTHPHQPVPKSVDTFLRFMCEVSSVKMASSRECASPHEPSAANAPLVVGAPRLTHTALTLTADILHYALDHNLLSFQNAELYIPRTIALINQQRANLFDNIHQYKFIYLELIAYLKQSRLI